MGAKPVVLQSALGVLLVAGAAGAAPVASVVPPAAVATAAAADSAIGFRRLHGAVDHFSISELTRTYERDLTFWANTGRRSHLDRGWLERHATTSLQSAPGAAEPDSSDIDVVRGTPKRDPTAMTPEERAAAEPPRPPIAVGIPSPVAVAGSFIGGIALLVKLITELAR